MSGLSQRRKFIGRDQGYVASAASMNDQSLARLSNFIAK